MNFTNCLDKYVDFAIRWGIPVWCGGFIICLAIGHAKDVESCTLGLSAGMCAITVLIVLHSQIERFINTVEAHRRNNVKFEVK